MIELEESFTANDRYLVEEHLQHGTDDFLLAGVGEATFVVPYRYRKAGLSETDAINLFKQDLLDFQHKEEQKYREAGLTVRTEEHNGERFVVPFSHRKENISAQYLAKYVEQTAQNKYDIIIEAHRDIRSRGYQAGLTNFSMAAANKYLNTIERIEQKEKEHQLRKVQQVAAQAPKKKSQTFGISAKEITTKIEQLITKTKDTVRKKKNTVGVSLLIGLSALGGSTLFNKGCNENTEQTELDSTRVEAYHYAGHDGVYVDFMGKEHSDSFGNIQRIMELKPEITAMLVALEGYADNAFKDGVGQETIGSGTTFYLDDNGKEIPVQMGETISSSESMNQKWRFIDCKMLKHLGDKLGRKCSDGELMACIGFGFCIGENALAKSEFYKSIQKNESLTEKSRKLTGFRQQKGVLKRAYILNACLTGKCTAKDLLDMPIYELSDKGYLNCALYRLDLHEILPCEKDKNGKYKKDPRGNDIPIIAEDGFCKYYNNFRSVYNKMQEKAAHSYENVRYVRDFMSENMIMAINENTNNNNNIIMVLNTERDYNRR